MKNFKTIALSLLLCSCTTMDPYTGESKTSNATTGAVGGAVVGAAIGAATASKNDRKKGVLTGAVAGAAIGGGGGYFMDVQEKKLRERLQGTGVQVKRDGNNIQLIMPGNITFDSGNAVIRSDFYGVLSSVTEILNEFKKTSITVSGHTDNTGGAALNQMLSEQRASAVKMFLIEKKISPSRVQSVGYSYRYPVASNDTEQGRQANRRVELQLVPTE